jgi:hypothetical protein
MTNPLIFHMVVQDNAYLNLDLDKVHE